MSGLEKSHLSIALTCFSIAGLLLWFSQHSDEIPASLMAIWCVSLVTASIALRLAILDFKREKTELTRAALAASLVYPATVLVVIIGLLIG